MTVSRHFYAIAGILTILTAASLSAPHMRAAAPTATPSNVKVVNTTANPVPTAAQGTTQVAGTVAVSALPAVSLANGASVGISGTPTVQVLDTKIRVSHNDFLLAADGADFGANDENNLYFVPLGKKLIVKDISVTAYLPTGQRIVQFNMADGTAPVLSGMPFEFQGVSLTSDVEAAHSTSEIAFNSGVDVFISFRRSSTAGPAFAYCTFNGYLEDAP